MQPDQHPAPSQADLFFGTSVHGWQELRVVRFHGREALSQPYRYDITLLRNETLDPLDLDALLNLPATLAIKTETHWRVVHGVISQAALLGHTNQLQLYQVALEPPLIRAAHRRRCRTFVNLTVKNVVDILLRNLSHNNLEGAGGLTQRQDEPQPWSADFEIFIEAAAYYRWLVVDESRINHATLRDYIVQYNETDLELLERLLAEEGISYFFEHGGDSVVMSITDQPGRPSPYPAERRHTLRAHADGTGATEREVITSIRSHRRLAPASVTMRDYSWRRTLEPYEARMSADTSYGHADHFIFPARDEAASGSPCSHPSRVARDRFDTERFTGFGRGRVRSLNPGYRFRLEDTASLQADRDYLTIAVESYAIQHELPAGMLEDEPFGFGEGSDLGTHGCRFSVLPADVPFRPPIPRGKARIDGVQTALVTAEERDGKPPEINADAYGRVRVRFPWDQRPADGTPSSCWLRVSQAWAGSHWGTLHTPRVGQEVLVAYMQGDPERPIIVGRVYNMQSPPPYDQEDHPTTSTIKSWSSPDGDGGFNELRMVDRSGHEEVFLHAQRDHKEVVRNNHSRNVGGNETISVGADQQIKIAKNRSLLVEGKAYTEVSLDDEHHVDGQRTVYSEKNHIMRTPAQFEIHAGDAKILMSTGFIHINNGTGASLTLAGGNLSINADDAMMLSAADVSVTSSGNTSIKSEYDNLVHSTGNTVINAGEKLSAKATGELAIKAATGQVTTSEDLMLKVGAVFEVTSKAAKINS